MRVPALDRLRAAALVMMLVHHFTKWLGGDPRGVIPGWDGFVVTDLAAPAFTIAAGASAVLWATKGPGGVSPWTVVRRYGLLVPIGMALQWLFTSHVPFDWGVLQALGVGVVVSTLVSMAVRTPSVVGVLALGALVVGPMTELAFEGDGGRFADIVGGVFPVVTYCGFALAGACGGLLLRRNPERGWQALALGGALTVVTLVLLEAGMPPDRYPGGVAFVIPGLAGTLLLFGVLDRWSAMPAAFGNHTLGIFIAHYAVFWVLTRLDVRSSMEPATALVFAFGAVLLFALVAPRMPQLPWSPRTGWARKPTRPDRSRLESPVRA
jgi:hypothetical protein